VSGDFLRNDLGIESPDGRSSPDHDHHQCGRHAVHRERSDHIPSDAINENQREMNHFAILSWQHSQVAFDVQASLTARYSSLNFVPDALGDVFLDGVAQNAFRQNVGTFNSLQLS
jgi:hypothetical protein